MNKRQSIPSLRFPEFSKSWIRKSLGEITTFHKGKGLPKADITKNGKLECIRYGELYTHYCELIFDIKSRTDISKDALFLSQANDVIIPASGETAIDISTASCVKKHGVALGGDINILRTDLNGTFLAYYLNNCKKTDIARYAQGISVIHLYSTQLKLLKLKIPVSDCEVDKIADFLSAIDKKISQLKEKHTLLQQYKKGIMQQLFSQKMRFKGDNGNAFPDWNETRLKSLFQEYKEKSKAENEYEVFTSARTGLMKQSDYYTEGRISEKSNCGFNIIPEGFITYRSRSDDRQFFFNANTLGKTGIISTYYPVFKMKNDQTNFFIELTRFYKNVFGRYAVGTSQVVLSFNELKKIRLAIPCDAEQKKIGSFAKSLDIKIAHVAEQIEQTEQFKKGLLQQMFV